MVKHLYSREQLSVFKHTIKFRAIRFVSDLNEHVYVKLIGLC